MTDHRAGPRPKGLCPACLELRHLRTGGLLGEHKRIYRKHYRSSGPCPGVNQAALLEGPHMPEPEPPTPDPSWPDQSPDANRLPDDGVLLEEARIVRLQPGDVVTLRLHYQVDVIERERVLTRLEALFPDNKVGLLEQADLVVVRAEEAAQ